MGLGRKSHRGCVIEVANLIKEGNVRQERKGTKHNHCTWVVHWFLTGAKVRNPDTALFAHTDNYIWMYISMVSVCLYTHTHTHIYLHLYFLSAIHWALPEAVIFVNSEHTQHILISKSIYSYNWRTYSLHNTVKLFSSLMNWPIPGLKWGKER